MQSAFRPAMILMLALNACSSAARGAEAEHASISLGSLLREMVDPDSVARWPQPAFTVRQASSYDRSRNAPDKPGWFANHDNSNYIRIATHAGRQERVMLDTDGPGAIVRFFLTSGGPRNGHIRLYLDNSDTPTIDWPTFDLLDSDLRIAEPLVLRHPAPLGRGGSTFYLPIPYFKHCKITLEESDLAHTDARYYHIDYRTYPAGASVETFNHDALENERPEISRVNQLLLNPPVFVGDSAPRGSEGFNGVIPATAQVGVSCSPEQTGAAAIRQLDLSVANDMPPAAREQALRSVVLRATFDDEVDAIWCPVGDFIGSGAGGRPLNSWTRTVDDHGNATFRWPMPFRKQVKFTLHNLGTFPVHARLTAHDSPWTWDDRSMYFHTSWHQQTNIPARPFRDWNFVTVTGRGRIVGDVMSVYNPLRAWYGEGNEKIWVDGESFPSHLGTAPKTTTMHPGLPIQPTKPRSPTTPGSTSRCRKAKMSTPDRAALMRFRSNTHYNSISRSKHGKTVWSTTPRPHTGMARPAQPRICPPSPPRPGSPWPRHRLRWFSKAQSNANRFR